LTPLANFVTANRRVKTYLLAELVRHLDQTLEVHLFRDFGPNGLQVEGRAEVRRVVTGVSAHLAFIEQAAPADLLVVHHGLIWGPGIDRITGLTARRLRALLSRETSLAAYHLPLDKHPRLGNNAGLADALGLEGARRWFGDVRGHALGLAVDLDTPIAAAELAGRLGEPRFVFPHGPAEVSTVGLCTGAASDLLEAAAAAGCQLFVTGELAERAGEVARELGITLVAAGHHRTEVFGPQRLATELAVRFPGLDVSFLDAPSPL
jgi:dinuclear metal center YbgI/SA1388 family protein